MLKKVAVVFEVESETQNEAEDYVMELLVDNLWPLLDTDRLVCYIVDDYES